MEKSKLHIDNKGNLNINFLKLYGLRGEFIRDEKMTVSFKTMFNCTYLTEEFILEKTDRITLFNHFNPN